MELAAGTSAIASSTRAARISLMLGNVVVGLCVLAPVGMLADLAAGLRVPIRDAGLLVTYGAIVLCIGSPVMAWLTSAIDRRTLLAGTMLVLVIGNAVSAFAPNYETLLALRIVMLAAAALYTPQAASTVAQLVPEARRSAAIAFVFLGWSLAIACGLPLVTFAASHLGWQATFVGLAATAVLVCGMLGATLPEGLHGTGANMRIWGAVLRNRLILLLLAITALQLCGSFAILTYLGPLLAARANAGAETVALFLALYGAAGFVGNVIATRMVDAVGALWTSFAFLCSILLGVTLWAIGAPVVMVMGLGMLFWGLGFAATNSMQQARLVAAAPDLSSASIALNTSAIYVGQALGSAIGGLLYARGHLPAIGYVAIAFVASALGCWALTRPEVARSETAERTS